MVDADLVSIASLIASSVGVIIAFILTFYVVNLNKKQRNSDEIYYRHQTLTNIRTIHNSVGEIFDISTGEDRRTPEEFEDNTMELKKFFRNNSVNLRLLIQDSKFTLSKWITLKPNERAEIQYIINSMSWTLETYFPEKNNSNELQQRIWTTHYPELETRKERIGEIVLDVTKKYG
ncbi:hypothetical protein K0U27_00775 [archaeon]|nr:hypothetical protein [archaeon]